MKGEWKSAAGGNVVAALAAPDRGAPDAWLSARLDEIRQAIHRAPNRTRHCMNHALIAIGGYRPALRDRAIAVAEAIGKVEVDHGETSCKTPAAVPYIRKMAQRRTVKRKAAARKTPPKKAKKVSRKPARRPAAARRRR
ncbi:MAG: hypothetical protein ACE5JG_02000 [Planctomycetota bacterium]